MLSLYTLTTVRLSVDDTKETTKTSVRVKDIDEVREGRNNEGKK